MEAFLKGCYLYSDGIYIAGMSGVISKINSQVKAFNTSGLNCQLLRFKSFYNRINVFYKQSDNVDYFDLRDVKIKDFQYIYIRKPGAVDYFFVNMLKSIKTISDKIKIVLEVPTYPYDYEFEKNVSGFLKYSIEKTFRRLLYKYVDRISVIGNYDTIFNIPTLEIDNGLDFENYVIRDVSLNNRDSIDICAVAKFYGPHGYERLFKGLYNYYKANPSTRVMLHMVGDGPMLAEYERIVKKLSLSQYVKFYGFLSGKELRDVYGVCDASIGSLGAYKKKMFDTHELKSTEALAYGIPFVCGCKASRLTDRGFKYFLELPNDNSDIQIDTIINFINELYCDEDILTITKNIRTFGEKYFSMVACMKNVIDYFKSSEEV